MEDKSNFHKKKASDALRLESIKRRKTEKAVQVKQIAAALSNVDSQTLKNKRIIFNSESDDDDGPQPTLKISKNSLDEKLTLFDSSSSEDEDYEQRFEIKKQFEGERGQELFEFSSQCPDERFKLDGRFQENEDGASCFTSEKSSAAKEQLDETELEKNKNLEILEKVLGFQVPKRPFNTIEKAKKKKYVHFDPESEDASNYIREQDSNLRDESKLKEMIAEEEYETNKEPVSKERFFEVATNLKQLLGSSDGQVNLGSTFKFFEDPDKQESSYSQSLTKPDILSSNTFNYSSPNDNRKELPQGSSLRTDATLADGYARPKKTFFMQPDDDRLKEGVAFFQRTESLDRLREQWPVIRNTLIEAYKNNRKMVSKFPKPRTKNFQNQKRYFKQ